MFQAVWYASDTYGRAAYRQRSCRVCCAMVISISFDSQRESCLCGSALREVGRINESGEYGPLGRNSTGSAPSRSESPNAIWAKKAYVPDEASSCDVDARCNDRTVVGLVAFAWTMGASGLQTHGYDQKVGYQNMCKVNDTMRTGLRDDISRFCGRTGAHVCISEWICWICMCSCISHGVHDCTASPPKN